MLIKINNPNKHLDWIVIETEAIVSIAPTISHPNHCLVSLTDRDAIYIKTELIEAIIEDLMRVPTDRA
jgi:hypothetical protein